MVEKNSRLECKFDEMDYNNQVNLLWNMVGIARAGREYNVSEFHYRDLELLDSCIKIAPQIGIEGLTKMAQTLSSKGFGRKIKLNELIEAA